MLIDVGNALALTFGHVHTLDVVYVCGGHYALTFQGLWHAFGHDHTSYGVYVMGGRVH